MKKDFIDFIDVVLRAVKHFAALLIELKKKKLKS